MVSIVLFRDPRAGSVPYVFAGYRRGCCTRGEGIKGFICGRVTVRGRRVCVSSVLGGFFLLVGELELGWDLECLGWLFKTEEV